MANRGHKSAKLAMLIEEQIRTAFRSRGWRLFVPEQFAGFGSHADVVDALVRLSDEGKLYGEAALRCPEGHDYELVPLDSLDLTQAPTCPVCAEPDLDEDPRAFLRFTVTDDWAEALGSTEKKKPGDRDLVIPAADEAPLVGTPLIQVFQIISRVNNETNIRGSGNVVNQGSGSVHNAPSAPATHLEMGASQTSGAEDKDPSLRKLLLQFLITAAVGGSVVIAALESDVVAFWFKKLTGGVAATASEPAAKAPPPTPPRAEASKRTR
jgi:hypothetical protein